MASNTFTAQELHEAAVSPTYVGGDFEVHVKPEVYEMLEQAADMRERCEDYIKTMQECGDNLYSKAIEEILTKILRGDAGKNKSSNQQKEY